MTKDTQQTIKAQSGPNYFEIIAITVTITMAMLFGYDRYIAQKISVFDLKGYLRSQKALLAAGAIDETEWQTNLQRLEQILNDEATNPHHVILLEDVVLRNGKGINLNQ